MDFEWDARKSRRNEVERGFDFWFAIRIFIGRTVEIPDTRRDYGEVRVKAIGQVGSTLYVVVYTDRGDVRRIVSARLANHKERALWLISG